MKTYKLIVLIGCVGILMSAASIEAVGPKAQDEARWTVWRIMNQLGESEKM